MNNLSGRTRSGLTANLTSKGEGTQSETAGLVARARTMMLISGLTTVLAIAAVVTVIGYRMYAAGNSPIEDVMALPKGARIVSMAGSGGRLAVMVDNNGIIEMHVFDLKTMKESGHLRFMNEQ